MSDRIGVMNKGHVVQVGSPTDIYERPTNLFVTAFIGDSNIIDVTVEKQCGRRASVRAAGQEVEVATSGNVPPGDRAKLVLRPENVVLGARAGAAGIRQTRMIIIDRIYQGALLRYRLRWGEQELLCEMQNQSHQESFLPGAEVDVGWDPDKAALLSA